MGKRAAGSVPEVMFVALVVSVVAEAASPLTAPLAIAMLVLLAEVTRPVASTLMTGTAEAEPYDAGATPLVGRRAAASVPEVILVAFVVLVVAEAASPLTALLAMAIGVLFADVIRPVLSIPITGTADAEP